MAVASSGVSGVFSVFEGVKGFRHVLATLFSVSKAEVKPRLPVREDAGQPPRR